MSWINTAINAIGHALAAVGKFFSSGKAEEALAEAANLASIAAPIVAEINTLVPNKTLTEITAVYQKYGVPFASQLDPNNPASANNALLNLASTVLQKNLPPAQAGAAISILNTAVQIAVTALQHTK